MEKTPQRRLSIIRITTFFIYYFSYTTLKVYFYQETKKNSSKVHYLYFLGFLVYYHNCISIKKNNK